MNVKSFLKWSMIATAAMVALAVVLNVAGYKSTGDTEDTSAATSQAGDASATASAPAVKGLGVSASQAIRGLQDLPWREGSEAIFCMTETGFAMRVQGDTSDVELVRVSFFATDKVEAKMTILKIAMLNVMGEKHADAAIKRIGANAGKRLLEESFAQGPYSVDMKISGEKNPMLTVTMKSLESTN